MSRQRIQDALEDLRRTWRRAESLEWALGGLSASLFSFGISVIFASFGWVRLGIAWWLGVSFAAVAVLVVNAVRRAAAATHRQMAMARMAEGLAPELGTGATSAVDLGERLSGSGEAFSRELAEAHLEDTAEKLRRLGLEERLRRARRGRQQRLSWVTLATAGWALVMLAALDGGRGRLLGWLRDPTAARVSDLPLAGDIRLTYRFPAYTGLPPRVVEGGDGSIAAVVGTEVELEAVADSDVREATLRVLDVDAKPAQAVPLQVEGRKLRGRLSVLRDGKYFFELVEKGGDRLQDRKHHSIRATLDAYPEVFLDAPVEDVELKDDRAVDVLWRARDDFGVGEVALVVEQEGRAEPVRIPLASGTAEERREGQYRWSIAELGLSPGTEVRFHVEAVDNDVINGPKKSTSATRRLVIFSARQRHGELLEQQRQILDAMVDLLAEELVSPFPAEGVKDLLAAREKQRAILGRMTELAGKLAQLVKALREDTLSGPEIATAFENVAEHVRKSERERAQAVARLTSTSPQAWRTLATRQQAAVRQLEKDVIYLDDLLAIQRIDELKETGKDLLASQRELQELLDRYRETQDPALRAQLEQRIGELKQKMLDLLGKMARIKEGLPGEYRNLESASMLQMDDQLQRLEKMLREGDLERAAAELEQLANMVENMVNSINEAEQEYGGERYEELREQLGEFAEQFRQIEEEQKTLAERSEDLLREYREKAVQQAGKSMDELVQKAREKTAEALRELDRVAEQTPNAFGDMRLQLDGARQRLLDLDNLLQQRDFSEARNVGMQAEQALRETQMSLDRQRTFPKESDAPQKLAQARKSNERAGERTREVNDMLDKLFPEPSQVLSQEQMAQMQRMMKRQQQLEQQAAQLGQRMDQLGEEVPLFGGEPRQNLESARGEMGRAVGQMQAGKLPGAAASKRRAADELGKLRQSLQQASQKGQGGLPMPLGGGGQGKGQDRGMAGGFESRDVEIPQSDRNRAAPRYRQELLEAAKQKAPEQYEEAVRRYYEELIK